MAKMTYRMSLQLAAKERGQERKLSIYLKCIFVEC